MRFMILVKANQDTEAGVMPEENLPRRWRPITRSW